MTKQTQLSILAVVAVLVVAGIVYLVIDKDAPQQTATVNDPNIVRYEDQTNSSSFSHQKDWQVSISYSFTRLIKSGLGQQDIILISYLPTQQKLNELKLGSSANAKIQIGNKTVETVKVLNSTYYLWTQDNRKILIQVDPAQDPLSDDVKKVIETLEL